VTPDPLQPVAVAPTVQRVTVSAERLQHVKEIEGELRFDDKTFGINPKILSAIGEFTPKWEKASKIQEQTMPTILSGKNLMGQATAGSGKTGAFGIGMLEAALRSSKAPFSCVCMAPSHEVAGTIYKALQGLNKYTQVPIALATPAVEGDLRSASIVIGTAGTILNKLGRPLQAKNLKMFVLDEADTMVDRDGQLDQVKKIVAKIEASGNRDFQRVLFSATYKDGVNRFAQQFVKCDTVVQTGSVVPKTVKQLYVRCRDADEKDSFVRQLWSLTALKQAIIFVARKADADRLYRLLKSEGFSCGVSHGGLNPDERKQVLEDFKDQKFSVLMSTSMLSRGIDVPEINMVINYDMPKTGQYGRQLDHEGYIQRIGRATRYGRLGMSFNLIAADDLAEQFQLEEYWATRGAANAFTVELLDVNVGKLAGGDDDEMERVAGLLEKYQKMGNKNE